MNRPITHVLALPPLHCLLTMSPTNISTWTTQKPASVCRLAGSKPLFVARERAITCTAGGRLSPACLSSLMPCPHILLHIPTMRASKPALYLPSILRSHRMGHSPASPTPSSDLEAPSTRCFPWCPCLLRHEPFEFSGSLRVSYPAPGTQPCHAC